MTVLGLSLGSATGFAFGAVGQTLCGTWPAGRPLVENLASVDAMGQIDRVVFVDSENAAEADREAVVAWAAARGADCRAVSFEEAAAAWSGRPARSAAEMIAKAVKRDEIVPNSGAAALALAAYLVA